MKFEEGGDEAGVIFEECGSVSMTIAAGAKECAAGIAVECEQRVGGAAGGVEITGFIEDRRGLRKGGDQEAVPTGEDLVIQVRTRNWSLREMSQLVPKSMA